MLLHHALIRTNFCTEMLTSLLGDQADQMKKDIIENPHFQIVLGRDQVKEEMALPTRDLATRTSTDPTFNFAHVNLRLKYFGICAIRRGMQWCWGKLGRMLNDE